MRFKEKTLNKGKLNLCENILYTTNKGEISNSLVVSLHFIDSYKSFPHHLGSKIDFTVRLRFVEGRYNSYTHPDQIGILLIYI